ncbi:hypothetical protein [Fluviicola sp.]|uniref:hypothetical protein n=1 Tax=Fluviicola sp. TaxID=1917219 RepID=UPI00262BDE2C|nr:hypothetical protein [Fluviicola sp.]
MKKRIQKHIDKEEYVKIYIVDQDGTSITNFNGYILEQDKQFILMSTNNDFFYDGITVIRKADISEIKRTENETFFQKIMEKENLEKEMFERKELLNFHLNSYQEMFQTIHQMNIPVIIETKYGDDDRFLIGPVASFHNKHVKINYFNSRGEYDLKPVSCKYKEITHLTIDSPYARLFYKYSKIVE